MASNFSKCKDFFITALIISFILKCILAHRCDVITYEETLYQTVELQDGRLMSCSGLIELHGCEGECMSNSIPSVRGPGGFERVIILFIM